MMDVVGDAVKMVVYVGPIWILGICQVVVLVYRISCGSAADAQKVEGTSDTNRKLCRTMMAYFGEEAGISARITLSAPLENLQFIHHQKYVSTTNVCEAPRTGTCWASTSIWPY